MTNNSATSWQQVVVMEFKKRHVTTDTMDFCPRQLVTPTDLLQTCRLCCGLVVDLLQGSIQLVSDLLQGNWRNGLWPLLSCHTHTDVISIGYYICTWVCNILLAGE